MHRLWSFWADLAFSPHLAAVSLDKPGVLSLSASWAVQLRARKSKVSGHQQMLAGRIIFKHYQIKVRKKGGIRFVKIKWFKEQRGDRCIMVKRKIA